MSEISQQLVTAARQFAGQVDRLKFKPPVAQVYNPLDYAWPAHELYLKKYGGNKKRVIFLGMNPGPFGMAQTGIPFGEIPAVRDWLGIHAKIGKPAKENPKRLVTGFDCKRSEVSGRRLWKLFASRFGSPEKFFADHFVENYCPLAFLVESGANFTPNKLPATEREKLFALCDDHVQQVLEILQPEWLIGIGDFARKRAEIIVGQKNIRVGQILHPSPASPMANRHDWGETATKELIELGVWK